MTSGTGERQKPRDTPPTVGDARRMTSGVQFASTHVSPEATDLCPPWNSLHRWRWRCPMEKIYFGSRRSHLWKRATFLLTAREQIKQCTHSGHKETVLPECLVPKETRVLGHHRL